MYKLSLTLFKPHQAAFGYLHCYFLVPVCSLKPPSFHFSVAFVLPVQMQHAQPHPLPSPLLTRSVFLCHDLFTLNASQP